MDEEAGPSSSGGSSSRNSRASISKPMQAYLYACQRAELLGLPTPTEAEWLASEEYAREREAQELDSHDDAVAQVTVYTRLFFFFRKAQLGWRDFDA